jgi:hypothetical protein
MIRRISKNNDLKDLIKSCPSGVIDDIIEIRYFISGHPETEIVATFEKVGSHLEAILPTSDLATLGNGVLMRRALYRVSDSAYPDGYYNLEFVDNLDVWLGDEETEDPFDPGYLTESDLKTINGESLVGVGNIDVVNYIPDYYATKSWVSGQGYLTSTALTGYATESWVSSQQFATQSWVENKSYASITYVQNIISSVESGIVTDLSSYATQSWVEAQGYITSNPDLSPYATKSWVSEQGYLTSAALTGYTTVSMFETAITYIGNEFNGRLTEYQSQVDREFSGVRSQISNLESDIGAIYSEFDYRFSAINYDLSSYATQDWVSSQNFLTSTSLTGYGFATESWVLDVVSNELSSYATQDWVSSNFLEESKVWTGTRSEWSELRASEKAFYTIALVIE